MEALQTGSSVKVMASPFVTSQTARVGGKMHVFLANFKGLQPRKKATQIPEENVEILFPPNAGSTAFVLPFLGKVQKLPVEPSGGQLRVVVPPIDKGSVVWLE
jgi:hypothetical protein